MICSSRSLLRQPLLTSFLRSYSSSLQGFSDSKIENRFLSDPKTIGVVGATVCAGQPRKGTELGPDLLRKTDLFEKVSQVGWNIVDSGNIEYSTFHEEQPSKYGAKSPKTCGNANLALHKALYQHLSAGRFGLTLGGDHSVASGSISAVLRNRPETVVFWIDAHADINTDQTSPSGNIHGMPVSLLSGLIDYNNMPGFEWMAELPKLNLNRIVYIGLRDVDPLEKEIMYKNGVKAYSMHDIDRFNIGPIMDRALNDVDPYNNRPIHLSFDIDSVDPAIAPSTGTPVLGGLTFREGAFICEFLAQTKRLCSMDITEVNPLLADERGASSTADIAKRMVSCAVGENLLWGNQSHYRLF